MGYPPPQAQDGRNHLETPVARARRNDPQTSKDAAASVRHISELKLEILKAFKFKGTMRDDELVYYLTEDVKGPKLAASEQSIRCRRHELKTQEKLITELRDGQGNVVKTEMPSHRGGIVWKAV